MEVILSVLGWMFFVYFVGYIVFAVVWYAWDWYQWLVHKKRDHKFPITADKSWQIHAIFSLIWPAMVIWSINHFFKLVLGKMLEIIWD